jgi:hypothetical protein
LSKKALKKLGVAERKAITAGDLFTDAEKSYFFGKKKHAYYHATGKNKTRKSIKGKYSSCAKDYLKYAIKYYKAKTTKAKTKIKKQVHLNKAFKFGKDDKTRKVKYMKKSFTLSMNPKKYKGKKQFSAFILGIGLHSAQDNFAHFRKKHTKFSDDIHRDYGNNGKKYVKEVMKNKRMIDAKFVTQKYVKEFLKKTKRL